MEDVASQLEAHLRDGGSEVNRVRGRVRMRVRVWVKAMNIVRAIVRVMDTGIVTVTARVRVRVDKLMLSFSKGIRHINGFQIHQKLISISSCSLHLGVG